MKSVDVLEDGGSCLPPRWLSLPPEQLGLKALEEGLDGSVVEAVSLA